MQPNKETPSGTWHGLGRTASPRPTPQSTDPDTFEAQPQPQPRRRHPRGKIPNLAFSPTSPPELIPSRPGGDKDKEEEEKEGEDSDPTTPSPPRPLGIVHALARPGKLVVTGRAEGKVGKLSIVEPGTPIPQGAKEIPGQPLADLARRLGGEVGGMNMRNGCSRTSCDGSEVLPRVAEQTVHDTDHSIAGGADGEEDEEIAGR